TRFPRISYARDRPAAHVLVANPGTRPRRALHAPELARPAARAQGESGVAARARRVGRRDPAAAAGGARGGAVPLAAAAVAGAFRRLHRGDARRAPRGPVRRL